MGSVGREILSLDVTALIDELNKGVAAELNDAFRYLLLSKLVKGPRAVELAGLFSQMAGSEWNHLTLLIERIVQLGGQPMGRPTLAERYSYTEYKEPPADPTDLDKIVAETLEGERAAIRYWHNLFEKTQRDDPVTAALASSALADEVKDEDRLESFIAYR